MQSTKSVIGSIVAMGLVAGCNLEVELDDISHTQQELAVHNDIYQNSAFANGTKLNGTKLNGTKLNGIDLSGLTLDATVFEGFRDDDGSLLIGTDFIGVEFEGELEDESTVTLRVDDMRYDSALDLYFYTVEYQDAGNWYNVCNGDVEAIPINAIWDADGDVSVIPGQFTFGCRGAAIAKCVEWGYKPWDTVQECDSSANCVTQPLGPVHQACTRMVRADYCGDGVAWTENGTLIDIWDMASINAETTGSGLSFEAGWAGDGATCVSHTRWADNTTYDAAMDYILSECPGVWAGPTDPDCGGPDSDFFADNGLGVDLKLREVLRNASQHNLRE